jgi:3',5'-cyclic AMP phosphodiesterase CpdA
MPIEFVAITGDITMERMDDGVTFTNGLSILKGLKMPFHLLPGNHDILVKRLKETSQVYTNFSGGFLTRAEYKGVELLFMYTEPLAQSFSVEGYEPLKQLEQSLREAGNKPVILFHHTPSVEDFYNNEMHPGWPRNEADKWVELLNAYPVRAAIAGHFHRDEMHMLGNVPLYVAPAVATSWGRATTFRIYEYRNGRIISYRTQYPE